MTALGLMAIPPLLSRLKTTTHPFLSSNQWRTTATSKLERRFSSLPSITTHGVSPLQGSEDALIRYITGKAKATELAHLIWQQVLRRGDTVIDATCGNGYDTLALVTIVSDESGRGCVYGFDIQQSALDNTASLLKSSTDPVQSGKVKLFQVCHSNMEAVLPEGQSFRLVAFNLGYLPGGNKRIITKPETTLEALEAATRVLKSDGLISIVVYVGHPGGREEWDAVTTFASRLPAGIWTSTRFEVLNRPDSPRLVLIFKK